jgi:hypothetical protein
VRAQPLSGSRHPERMRLRYEPHLTRQHRAKRLQSVAFTAGTGKSHLLVARGVAAVAAGYRVRYFTAAELVEILYRGRPLGDTEMLVPRPRALRHR